MAFHIPYLMPTLPIENGLISQTERESFSQEIIYGLFTQPIFALCL